MLTSLYIHIPFCNQICTYCDFHKEMATDFKKEEYIIALIKELEHHSDKYVNLKTIYIGGGTPSSLSHSLLEKLLSKISQVIELENIVEYSIETNPNDINENFALLIKKYGLNRVSIGVQTFNTGHLKFLGRQHSINDIYKSIYIINNVGISNISIDLIFSLVNQTIDQLEYDLEEAVKLNIKHISFYSLILEEKTKLFYLYEKEKISMNSEDLEGLMYNKVMDFLNSHGFMQYEISNFSKPSYESMHNSAYWLNEEYLGLGSGAHSLFNKKRFNSVLSVKKYIENIKGDIFDDYTYYDYDELSDTVMLGLRLTHGVNVEEINSKYKVNLIAKYPEINRFIHNNILQLKNGYLSFTKEGILLGNEVFKIFVEVL